MRSASNVPPRVAEWTRYLVLVVIFSAAALQTAYGQGNGPESAADPAQELERYQQGLEYLEERDRELDGRDDSPVVDVPEREGSDLPQGPDFYLRGVQFSASKVLDDDDLKRVADEFVGRTITFDELEALVAKINGLYEERGYLTARALVPPQEIQEGIVRIRLVEAEVGRINIESQYVYPWYLKSRLSAREGELLKLPELRDDLNFLNRTSEITGRADLAPGENVGETDVTIRVEEPDRTSIRGYVDNLGNRTTGRERIGTIVNLFSPLGITDRLTLNAALSEGTVSGFASYSVPVPFHGARFEVRYARNDLEVIEGQFADLGIEGQSQTIEATYNQPLLRTDRWSVDGFLRGRQVNSQTELADTRISESDIIAGTGGASASWIGDGTQISLRGDVTMGREIDLFDNTQRYTVHNARLSWTQRITETVYTVASGRWQLSSIEDLPSVALFQAGGFSSVRGYRPNVVSGDEGLSGQSELRWRVRDWATPFVFADGGLVRRTAGDEGRVDDGIVGAGAGVLFRIGDHVSGEVAVGYGFNDVVADQEHVQLHFRLSANWP